MTEDAISSFQQKYRDLVAQEAAEFRSRISGASLQDVNEIPFRQAATSQELNTVPEVGSINQAASAPRTPWFCSAQDGSGNITITPGLILERPGTTVGGTPITNLPAPTLAVSGSGTALVWLELTVSKTLDTAGRFALRTQYSSSLVSTGSSLPSNTSTKEYVLLATYVSGAKTNQWVTTNINMFFTASDASGNTFRTTFPAP
jgi:hypothetical protein